MIRRPAVAGYFYTDDTEELQRELREYAAGTERRKVLGVISPHAGYRFSGPTAGLLFSCTEIPATQIVLGPKHRPGGSPLAYQATGSWETPLGNYPVNEQLASSLAASIPSLMDDPIPHRAEHSIEVQVPFLQSERPDGSFVPIACGHLTRDQVESLGKSLAAVVSELPEDERPLLVASSDMNHYEDETRTLEKDELALDRVRALDPRGLLDVCASHDISMCGVIPSAVMLTAALELGASQTEVLEHTTSARASGDTQRVVGYAAIQVW